MGYFDAIRTRRHDTPTATALAEPTPYNGTDTPYALAALRGEAENVANAPEGARNDTLNRAAFRMGQHVGAGNIHPHTVRAALTAAAHTAGLPQHEIDTILRDTETGGLNNGTRHPRQPLNTITIPEPIILPSLEPDTDDDDGDGWDTASWAPVNLDTVLDGTYEPELPTLMPRDDGVCLLYPGRVHSFHGESESGKSMVAQAEVARLITHHRPVLYLDFESDHAAVTNRMLELGAHPHDIRTHLTYVHPDVDPRRFPHEREAAAALMARRFDLAVIDGVTDALGIFDQSSKDNDDISAFMRLLPRPLAARTGAAVVLIDHVAKDTETRGRFAIGGQSKMAALDGAAYVVDVIEPLGRGRQGMLALRVGKDRPGGVRGNCPPSRRADRLQDAARVVVDSSRGDHTRITVTVTAPPHRDGDITAPAEFRPTGYMEKVSRALEDAPGPLTVAQLQELVGGGKKTDNPRQIAVSILDREGHIQRVQQGPGKPILHEILRPYRQALDPKSDAYIPPAQPMPDFYEAPENPILEAAGNPPSPPLNPPSRGGQNGPSPHPPPPTGVGVGPWADSGATTLPPTTTTGLDHCKTCFTTTQPSLLGGSGLCPACARRAGEIVSGGSTS